MTIHKVEIDKFENFNIYKDYGILSWLSICTVSITIYFNNKLAKVEKAKQKNYVNTTKLKSINPKIYSTIMVQDVEKENTQPIYESID